MKRIALLALASGMAIAAASPANAVVTISNTGATPNAWTVTGPGFNSPAVTVTPTLPQDWTPNSTVSSWVSVNAQGVSSTAPTTSNGNYTYSTSFTGNVGDILNFSFWADDVVTSMLVDGVSQAISGGTYRNSTAGSFVVTQSQIAHSLSFTVLNNGGNPQTNPTGFRFEAGAVPEPATWGMMIVGFGLMGGVLRRRSTKVAFA